MRSALVVLGLLVVASTSACGGAPTRIVDAAPQFYAAGCTNEPWKIEAVLNEGESYDDNLRRTLTVKIDGQTAISGELSGGKDANGEVTGKHDGHALTAVCSSKPRQDNPEIPDLRCVLMVDNQRTITLSF